VVELHVDPRRDHIDLAPSERPVGVLGIDELSRPQAEVFECARVLPGVPGNAPPRRPSAGQILRTVQGRIVPNDPSDRIALVGHRGEPNRQAPFGLGLGGEQVRDRAQREVSVPRSYRFGPRREPLQGPIGRPGTTHELDLEALRREQSALLRCKSRQVQAADAVSTPAHQPHTFHTSITSVELSIWMNWLSFQRFVGVLRSPKAPGRGGRTYRLTRARPVGERSVARSELPW
jgi:hypothetical protein